MSDPIVFVIDDEPGIASLCERLLHRAAFQVYSFTQPAEGLAQLEHSQADLLLVDIRMPGMDGFQVIDAARRSHPDLAVVIMTGFGTVEMAIQALQRGADGLILKPFAGAELVQTVRRALQESQNKRDVSRLQALRPLFTVTETLFAETNPERLQVLLLDAVIGQLHCTQVGIYARQGDESRLRLIAGRGDPLPEQESCPTAGLVGRAEALKAPLWVNAAGPGDPELQREVARLNLISILAAPVALRDGSLTFWAARAQGALPFRASDLELFVILSRQAAAALENARLHADLRAYLRQVEESQRALIQAEKMATVGRLTASLAHEINNPLQAVQNCLHLAGRQELNTADRQKYLSLAQTELDRLMTTVQRMLDFYRPSAVDRKPTNLNQLIEHLLELVAAQLSERQVRVKTRLAARLPLVVVVKDQIQQVFLNLALNAMEAMPQGGLLSIITTAVVGKKSVEISFADTGPGISAAERERIFEPFVSAKDGGAGLGLAVSYGIIAAHGGSIEVISDEGRGACFRVTLPLES